MTGTTHTRHSEWDAAYVLGALSPADRRDFEDHLEDCERCRGAVAELSALPGLLGRLDRPRGLALLREPGDTAPPAGLIERIEARERGRRRARRIRLTAGFALAAAIAAVLALVLPAFIAPAPAFAADLVPVSAGIPVQAHVELTGEGWGTRIDMECSYHPAGETDDTYGTMGFSMWVVDRSGAETQVSTWKASPTVQVSATTGLGISDIAEIEVRTARGDQVLLAAEVPSPSEP